MEDVPPVPNESAPSVDATADVVVASKTNAVDGIHNIKTPLPPPAKAIEITEIAVGNVVKLVESAIVTALVKAPETATETVDPIVAIAEELAYRESVREKNEMRALLVAQRKKVKIAIKKAL